MTIAQLQEFQDCKVILRLTDGEVLSARIDFIDPEYQDIIVEVLETTRPQQYKGPKNAVYTVKAADITSAEKSAV